MDPSFVDPTNWRAALPVLTGRLVTLLEPVAHHAGPLLDLFATGEVGRFGLEEPVTEETVQQLIARAQVERGSGTALTYLVGVGSMRTFAGVIQVRQLDPMFETAEWECLIAPAWRGTGVFVEAARLVASFVFGSVGAYRLEARVLVQNGRANGALRKIGAVQEGVLRRSVRRGGEYFDQVLWSVLKEDWGDRWLSPVSRVH